ncbi:flap endonuclease GEN isoform X1 [Pieris brassicae]|uniref:flap endonuclease GEN isoform X1 n=1 Tax=Pieris brassicae TaxID=7116 RepID=UPI001E66110D|nr:flap endonuclease GEN isoform X1 [Pieris brassicae]
MGIKGLWNVLSPYCEKKSLHEIRGETVAVDLAGWVCDSQNVTDYYIQPKLYLRNLFFRTVYLLLADINPIFILEGDAPELKRDVMAARNAIQFRGAAPKSQAKSQAPSVSRKRFKGVLKECETLLKSMGVRCVKGSGEAEATCASLNSKRLVDAVVSQDSDCFAYGARRVYRNFSVSSSAGGGAMQGSVDCYDAEKMFQANGFGRKKMIALALLCGCDYGVGACGSSINTVVTFLHTVKDEDIIPRLLSWVTDTKEYEERARWASQPGRCDKCGHVGRTHIKNGCPMCNTHRSCNDLGHKSKVLESKRELSLRDRALSCGMPFPEPKVMKEFLNATSDVGLGTIPQPSLIQFVKIMSKKLDWTERYCVEKFLPLLTKWHLQTCVPCKTIQPVEIKKKRNPRGVPSYEVVWSDISGQYEALIPDEQIKDGEVMADIWMTLERQDLMKEFYPELVERYEESIKKPPKVKKTREKKPADPKTDKPKRKYTRKQKISNLNSSMKNLSLSKSLNLSVSVNKLKRKIKRSAKGTIENYLKKRKSSLNSLSRNESRKKLDKGSKIAQGDQSADIVSRDYERNLETIRGLSGHGSKSRLVYEAKEVDYKKERKSINDLSNIEYDKSVNYNVVSTDSEGKYFEKGNTYGINAINKEIDISAAEDVVNKRSFAKDNFDNKENLIHILDTDIESDLSGIVDDIVSKAPIFTTAKVNNNLVKLVFQKRMDINCSTPKNSPQKSRNTSYFFDKLVEGDAFEMSLDNDTVDYSLPDIQI